MDRRMLPSPGNGRATRDRRVPARPHCLLLKTRFCFYFYLLPFYLNRTVTSLTLALVAFAFIAAPDHFFKEGSATGQRRPTTKPRPQPLRRGVSIDYSKFSHATRQHQGDCKTCHQVPTSNWPKARGFPDIADFPGHAACVSCHRQQFFKGATPAICAD